MSYMSRLALLIAFVGVFSILWPEGLGAQQPRRVVRDLARLRPPVTTWPNQRPVHSEWQLGVHADDTRTGMRITSVVRGSAAARAGLEPGDKILTVGTERVGLIGRKSVPVRKVLRRQADFQGDVVLLVKRRRSRGLTNLSIRLDRVGGSQVFTN